jgi:hypothetical protein
MESMGWRDRLRDALGGRPDAVPRGPVVTSSPIDDDAEPHEALPLFVHRLNRLTVEQWRRIEEIWQADSADPVRLAARTEAEGRVESVARETHRTVAVQSDVHLEFADTKSRLLATSSPAVRTRLQAIESELRGRSAIRRDALLALANRDSLSPDDFAALYAPFEAFIPRADLERDADDWHTGPPGSREAATDAPQSAPEPGSAVPEPGSIGDPLRPAATADTADSANPRRDVAWGDEERQQR